jgi:Protein kinase domain/D-mannose binding lectin/S-locus glycoprotein domain/PAN-like domain
MANTCFHVILIQLLFLLRNLEAQAPSSLNRGSSLEVERYDHPFLTSEDKTFSCGFHPVLGKNAFTFSIWFTSSINNRTVVWTANRDSPVNGHKSEISFRRDGNLVLRDVNGSMVWSTSTYSLDASTISLLNTGNLVINNSKGNIIWQSFDSPTDTLLPYQLLRKGNRVVSAMAKGEASSGYYSLFFDNDNVLKLMYDGPNISSIYWPGGSVFQNARTYYNSSRLAVLDKTGQFISSDGLSISASDLGGSHIRRLTLDSDGNLRMYSLNKSDGSWEVSWEAISQPCNVHGLCGPNAICQYWQGISCTCLPGYEMNNPNSWNEGCKPKFVPSCDVAKSRFLELPYVDFYGFDIGYESQISYDDCEKLCLQNCTCTGFGYRIDGEGVCYPKGILFNGYNSTNFPGLFYVRLPVDSNYSVSETHNSLDCSNVKPDIVIGSPSMFGTTQNNTNWSFIFIFIGVFGALETVLLVIGWWFLLRDGDVSKSVEEGYKMVFSQFRRFTYRELKEATGNFKEEIGRGGSGIVYRGVLDDKRVVAVKKLNDVTQGEEEFGAEVSVIGHINHMNLVRMFGLCSERQHRLLVYEHMENQSLDKYLFGNEMALEWRQRFRIALGAAKGLAYLHHECLEWIIHCDVKPENILLARDFEPKIADFGLVKLSKRDGSGFNPTQMRGTMGYMAPEWTLHLPITSKVDVYSYGVVLLEMVMGKRVSDWMPDDGERRMRSFTAQLRQVLEAGDESVIASLVDVRLQGQFDHQQVITMLQMAAVCLEEDRKKRPAMDEVVKDLMAVEERDLDEM